MKIYYYIVKQTYQQMIVDSILLILIVLGLQLVKNKFPNFLFFPKGAVLFLPPEDSPEENKSNKKKEQKEREVSVIKIQYQNVKDYPFSSQLSRVLLTAVALLLFVAIRIPISYLYAYESMISFYVLTLILVYTLKLGVETFILTNYSRMVCVLVGLGLNLIFFFLFYFLSNIEGVYDQTIKEVVEDYVNHLEIVFNRRLDFVTENLVLFLVFVVNFFVIIAVIPSIVKFGNWYAKTLKETHYEDENGEQITMAKRKDREDTGMKEKETILKEESKALINKLNLYLGFMLILIVFSHRYALNFLDDPVVDILRVACMGVCCYVICSTMGSAIEFNGSFAYKYVLDFFKEEDSAKKIEIKKKIVPYIYYIWYHYFQFIIRLVLPLFLFLLLLTWKYLFYQVQIVSQPITQRAINIDIECPLNTDTISVLESLYSCPANVTLPQENPYKYFLSGMLETIPENLSHIAIQANMQKYAILTRNLMLEFSQLLFWYSSVSIYLLTVFYIGFLRKTVYDM